MAAAARGNGRVGVTVVDEGGGVTAWWRTGKTVNRRAVYSKGIKQIILCIDVLYSPS